MEGLINVSHYKELKYIVLGQESQALQLVLMPGQKIVTAENSVQYMSENIRLRNKYSIRERFKQFFTGSRRLDCVAQNLDAIGYIGVTQNKGRITVLEMDEGTFYVREEYVLAHTSSIEIVINNKFNGAKHVKHPFFKVITRKQMPSMFQDFLQSDAMIPLDKSYPEDDTELIFIHSHESFIEKRLGDDETLLVSKEALVVFTEGIMIDAEGDYLRLRGPGQVYLETSRDRDTGLRGFMLMPSELTR